MQNRLKIRSRTDSVTSSSVICLKRQWTAGWDINLLLIRGARYQFKLTSTDVEHLRLSDEREINSNPG